MAKDKQVPPGYVFVYTKYITLRNGKRIYAAWYGHDAFYIKVRAEKQR